MTAQKMTAEHRRLREAYSGFVQPWKKWGPYISERSWATVREDYSPQGDAWGFLPHDMARSKAYRWGEDGIGGICDRYQILVFAWAFWNGRDPILKERLFGVTPHEGNRGEDVKEYYFYLDSTPTHSYMKMLYKYPQAPFPYQELVDENRKRGGRGFEYELLDTGVFDEDRYFDIFIEYAKAGPEDIGIQLEAFNRGPEDSELHILPHLWFRNTWSWNAHLKAQPVISPGPADKGWLSLEADDSPAELPGNLPFEYRLGRLYLYAPAGGDLLFTNNETNCERLYGVASRTPNNKDAFHRHVISYQDCLRPDQTGTKSCLHYKTTIASGSSKTLRFRLTRESLGDPLGEVEKIILVRKKEADEFYDSVHPPRANAEERMIQRQALAGMLWSKQAYIFDVRLWFAGDTELAPPPQERRQIRNAHWQHLNSMRVLSMPDKWEYPWFAAWDLAFQCLTLALVDPDFAKENLWFLLFEQFQHPNGQIPAYEWEFSDLNPPVHAWACWRVYNIERERAGRADREFLEKCFHKLLINFAWWVNKVDSQGNNLFEGGFLGLDNIAVVDRSDRLPGGAVLEQSDGTGWMAFFCLYLMRIALELSKENKVYEGLATKFFQHYVYIAAAMKNMGGRNYQLWDEKDGYFYDVLRYPNGEFHRFRVRSLVGLIPLFAVEILEDEKLRGHEEFLGNMDWFIRNRPDLVGHACYSDHRNGQSRHVLAIVNEHQLSRILERLRDCGEFLSEAGICSLSKFHKDHPFVWEGKEVRYEPAEADVKIKGGNSNWRGPIWFPTSYLIIESLRKLASAFEGSNSGSAEPAALADEVAERMIGLFRLNGEGKRPVFGGAKKFQDPHWRDYLLFYEYFNGDDGAGLGASHQTGWTGLVANLIDESRR
ncbi:MAG: MGH1-like glycoside hydrolase domain-containing protein [Acidobacteriota bacterium]